MHICFLEHLDTLFRNTLHLQTWKTSKINFCFNFYTFLPSKIKLGLFKLYQYWKGVSYYMYVFSLSKYVLVIPKLEKCHRHNSGLWKKIDANVTIWIFDLLLQTKKCSKLIDWKILQYWQSKTEGLFKDAT